MVTHNSSISSEISFVEKNINLDTNLDFNQGFKELLDSPDGATLVKGGITTAKEVHTSKVSEGINEVILHKVYFSPAIVEVGLIVETSEYEIKIWNATLDSNKNISQIQVVPSSGLNIIDNDIPELLTCGSDTKHTLQVLKDGPPIQNSTIIYTIGGDTFELIVTGQRIVAFIHESDGKNGVKISYGFNTKIYKNDFFVEQRFPLQLTPLRVQKCEFLEEKKRARLFLNDVKNKTKLIIGIPIYVEPIFVNSDIEGATVISPENEIQFLYNLQRLSDLVLILSDDENIAPEIKEISSVTNESIILEESVKNAFNDPNKVVIFPLKIGVIDQVEYKILHDSALESSLQFKELRVDNG